MASNDEIMDKLDIIQNRIIGIETSVEERKNIKTETAEMNENRSTVLLLKFSELEEKIFKIINDEIIRQQKDFKSIQEQFNRKLILQNKQNEKQTAELLLKTSKSAKELKSWLVHISRKTFPRYFAYILFLLVLLNGVCGFKLHEFVQNRNCENVFEQFYQVRFDEEISKPMMNAEQQATEYLEQKKKEADQYLKTKMVEADSKADKEYELRLNAYVENAKKEATKTVKKNKPEEEK